MNSTPQIAEKVRALDQSKQECAISEQNRKELAVKLQSTQQQLDLAREQLQSQRSSFDHQISALTTEQSSERKGNKLYARILSKLLNLKLHASLPVKSELMSLAIIRCCLEWQIQRQKLETSIATSAKQIAAKSRAHAQQQQMYYKNLKDMQQQIEENVTAQFRKVEDQLNIVFTSETV